jgi:hypothetical protein
MKSTINLFKALPIEYSGTAKCSDAVLEKTLRRGFIFSPEVIYNYSEAELLGFIEEISLTAEQMNSSFHKSWKKVAETDIEQLLIEQLVHYVSTYGFKHLGIYSEDTIYIPVEELEIPSMDIDKIGITIIKGYTEDELKTKLMALLQTGIALSDTTIDDILDVVEYVGVNNKDIELIKNKEVKIALYDYLGIVPSDPIEFLRYVVFKSTEKKLLIKNDVTIDAIKTGADVSHLFAQYNEFHRLAEIFYRFKPLFLAFRANGRLKPTINKIRRLATDHHVPMKRDYLNDFTSIMTRDEPIDYIKLRAELKKVNVFRKIRLAYALNYRCGNTNSIMYKVRNGKSYATEFNFDYPLTAKHSLDVVMRSIVDNLNVKGKKIHIPNYMNYALPATEKQFTGNLPSGSYITIPHDMIVGIYWDDVDYHTIDLDLSLLNENDGKIGWDSSYRNESRTILFSGDITAAPNGASELFYVQKQNLTNSIMFVNYYNYNEEIEVPFKIVVAKECADNFGKNYMVDPNNVICIADSVINQKQKILGMLAVTPDESRFYFAESYLGRSITSSGNEYVRQSRDYLSAFYKNAISLNDVLKKAGAILVDEKDDCDIDLSPESIDKSTIINLLVGK